jgi:hypothetical protein
MYKVHSEYKPNQTEQVISIESASEAWKVFFWRYVSIQLARTVEENNKSKGWLEFVKVNETLAPLEFTDEAPKNKDKGNE